MFDEKYKRTVHANIKLVKLVRRSTNVVIAALSASKHKERSGMMRSKHTRHSEKLFYNIIYTGFHTRICSEDMQGLS
jgi:hypothetical protein